MAEYFIPVNNFSKFEEVCAKVSSRLVRAGLEPVDTPLPAYEDVKEINGKTVAVYSVLFNAEVIKMGGWELLAALDHATEAGAIIRAFGGVDVPEKYRTASCVCDHCGVNRRRNTTYVLRHQETGAYTQVGSTCLDLFTGVNTGKLVARAEMLHYLETSLRNLCEEGFGSSVMYSLERFAGIVAAVVRTEGFITKKMANESEDPYLLSTAVVAQDKYWSRRPIRVEETDSEIAEAALMYALSIETPKNDYEHNIKVVAGLSYISSKHLGIAAAIVGCYMRDQARDRAAGSAATLENFSGVIELLKRPKARFPKITLLTANGDTVVLSVAGSSSVNAGMVNVTDGGPYGANVWYGKVSPEGRWLPSGRIAPEVTSSVTALLAALAAEPAKVAAEYGRLTGNCSFCKKPLADARSVAVGYGKACAANYGLPWGTVCP